MSTGGGPGGAGRPLLRGRLLALGGIVLVALTLRLAVGAVSPLFDRIDPDIPLGATMLALIGTAPPVLFGLAGLLTPPATRRFGLETTLVASLLIGGVGHVVRAVAHDPVVLLIGTALALLGAGVGNVLLPPAVKRYFPDRVGGMTSLYATVIALGATLPPATAVPLADAAGWRVSVGVWVVLCVVAVIPWVAQLIAHGRHVERLDTGAQAVEAQHAGIGGRLLRSPVAWSIGLLFGLSSIHFYAIFAWLPSLLVDLSGLDAAQAGLVLGLFALYGIPASFLVPLLARRWALVMTGVAVAGLVVGYLGMLVIPSVVPVLWVLLIAAGTGLFPLALTLIGLRSRTHVGAIALSGFVQGIGYSLGMLGPLVAGILLSVTGGWTLALWFLLATALLAVPAFVVLRAPRFVEDDVAPKPVQPAG
ncbi:MAG: MFS transporter [Microbacteriaceae bacterium]|nr:MFS transporter [Microbacteriaceae bacterium]